MLASRRERQRAERSVERRRKAEGQRLVRITVAEAKAGHDGHAQAREPFAEHAAHVGAGGRRAIREIAHHDARDAIEAPRREERREQAIDAVGALRHVLERKDGAVRNAPATAGRAGHEQRQIASDERPARVPWRPTFEALDVAA